jgi:imidazoleglycerol phosphate synthase glutamine amidotransferase subunit HisH
MGFLTGRAERFPDTVRVPQLGWNRVQPDDDCRLLLPGWAYFANSYRLTGRTDGWSCAFTDHGGPFVSAVERGPVLACQFHPELSGHWGLSLVARWLAYEGGTGGGSC